MSRPRRHVLAAPFFRMVLATERNRADRSGRPFGLLAVSLRDAQSAAPPVVWDAVTMALGAVVRRTDMLGWLQDGRVLGIVMPDISETRLPGMPGEIEARIHDELRRRRCSHIAAAVSIRAYGAAPSSLTGTYDRVKRALDVVGSLVLLVLLSPFLAVIALAVATTSPGGVLFRQVRIGHGMKPFTMLKFRTMYAGADVEVHKAFVHRFISSSGAPLAGARPGTFKLADDPRITSVGRLLRKTSLDELPQLWNALRGDMSLVGPRPALPYEVEQYQPWHRRRFFGAKPGITGLWQVTGRSRTTFNDMVRLDLRYARARSFLTDVKILLATPAAVVSGKGAE